MPTLLSPRERLSVGKLLPFEKLQSTCKSYFPKPYLLGDVFSHNTMFSFMAPEEGFKNATQTNAGVIEDPRVHCGCQKTYQ